MLSKRPFLGPAIVLLCLLSHEFAAQQPLTGDVSVLVSAMDKYGRIVSNLRKEDIQIFEDGVPRPITAVSNADPLPISVEVLIDESVSMRNQIVGQAPLIRQFLNFTIRKGRDNAAVTAFSTISSRHQDSTDDLANLHTAINKITAAVGTSTPKNKTLLYDAVVEATNRLASATGRKVVLVVSDGFDNSSRTSHSKTIDTLQKADVAVYSISRYPPGTNTLRLLAEDTGGILCSPSTDGDIERGLRQMAREMASQQVITFQPAVLKQPNKFRNIRIETTRPELKGLTFKHRRRYYSPS